MLDKVLRLKKRLSFSKGERFFFLFLCFFTPPLLSQFFSFNVALLLSLIPLAFVLFLLLEWEEKMRRSVSLLVEKKVEELKSGHHIEEQGGESHHEISLLKSSLKEQRIHLEEEIFQIKKQKEELSFELERKKEEKRSSLIEIEDLKRQLEAQKNEHEGQRNEVALQQNRKDHLLAEYTQTIAEQRMIIEKKQRYILKLETKVRDLMYEIRSLLQLEESSPSQESLPLIEMEENKSFENITFSGKGAKANFDVSLLLQKYLKKAESFTGADHLSSQKKNRFLEFSESYTIDFRHLFETIKDETTGIIFVYSQVEEKILFANNLVKTVLGISPERFSKDFSLFVSSSAPEWKRVVQKVVQTGEMNFSLNFQNKEGKEILFQCFVGIIQSGPFAGNMIGLLIPSDQL